jgi:manganese/zinc/iron transport system permease protein
LETVLQFFSLQDANVRYVVLGTMLLAISSAVVGCFSFLKKKSLAGDAVAHAVLPGVCLAFLLAGNKNPLALLIGSFLTGWFSLVCIDFITSKTKLKEDTAIGLVLSVFFGIGILLLTTIQHSGNAEQAGLESFIFGKAAALIGTDLLIFAVLSITLVLAVLLFFKEFTLIAFDESFAKVIGFPVRGLELLLTTLTVMAVVVGIQAVGVVLMSAMLITPAAAARFWTDRLKIMVLLAAIFGALAALGGSFVSYLYANMPTGAWIVFLVSLLAGVSFLFAPKKGIVARYFKQKKHKLRFAEENILKTLYHLGEKNKDFFRTYTTHEIIEKRQYETNYLQEGLKRLKKQGYVLQNKEQNTSIDSFLEQHWRFTNEGYERGLRVTKLHRLWEVYLTEYLRIAPDHVHDDAETMEHIITPELEKTLEAWLKYPKNDPHNTEIPYR